MYNRRLSAAMFARPVFAGGVLGVSTACHATGTEGEGGAGGFGAQQQVVGARAARMSGGLPSAITLPIDISSALSPTAASRGASSGSGGASGNSLVSGGSTYSRGWWVVPTTRRVRGTTTTGTVTGESGGPTGGDRGGDRRGDRGGDRVGDRGGDSATRPAPGTNAPSNLGGLLVHSGAEMDIIFVEPARAGEPTTTIEIQLTKPDGTLLVGAEKLARGCYYLVVDDQAKGVRISRAYPWNSSEAYPHDATARAVFNAMRKAALASGKPGMAELPDLTGP